MVRKIRALGLISGGLDSTLAARLLIEQGIEIRGVNFNTGFCIIEPRRRGKRDGKEVDNLCQEALKAGEDLRFAVDVVDFSSEYLDIVTNPRWGYGKNANPCIDCRIMMLRKAKEMMADLDADFVFTGEVLGQRPMTQHRPTLRQIERESGLEGYLLRPLSALKLQETEPERKGWVDRSKLKDFTGRSRKPQIVLAKDFGLEDYPQPAGGCCYLTDPLYGRKFFDYLKHLAPGREVTFEDFNLLKLGRHLRLSDTLKVVVGRNEQENNELEHYTGGRWALTPVDVVGPIVLVDRDISQDDLMLAARILARYSDGKEEPSVKVKCSLNGKEEVLDAQPLPQEETQRYIFK